MKTVGIALLLTIGVAVAVSAFTAIWVGMLYVWHLLFGWEYQDAAGESTIESIYGNGLTFLVVMFVVFNVMVWQHNRDMEKIDRLINEKRNW